MRLLSYDDSIVDRKITAEHSDRIKRRLEDYERYHNRLVANFKLREDHLKLLRNMVFVGMYPGDSVSIGVDGKRPFGNSWPYSDVAEILGWELPNDDLSDDQQIAAAILMDELPLALNEIICTLEWQHIPKVGDPK